MIRNLKEMGMSNRDIAREIGISRNKVSRMLKKTPYIQRWLHTTGMSVHIPQSGQY
jgi:IS30 family transposase